jgi:predicted ATP-dependent endonuclease of OLD family
LTYITEFSVEGLAGRTGVYSKKLNKDVNIFFGLNGSGKTSLLKILHSALLNETSVISNTAFRSAEVKFYSVNYDKVITRTITQNKPEVQKDALVESETSEGLSYTLAYQAQLNRILALNKTSSEWTTKTKLPKRTGPFRHQYLPTSRLWFSGGDSSYSGGTIVSEEQLDSMFQNLLVALWSSYIGEVLDKVRTAQEEGLTNILKWILSSDSTHSKHKTTKLDADTAYERVKSFLERQNAQKILGSKDEFAVQYMKSEAIKSVVNYIDEVEVSIASAMSPRNQLQNLISNLFSGNKKVVLTDKSIDVVAEDKTPIGVASLSSGEKHLLRILVEVLHGENNCLLIDEPEISMHVDWQKELISAMRTVNPHVQLIIATHSPEVMADVDDDKIFRL